MAYGSRRYVSDHGARPPVRSTPHDPARRRVPGFDGLRVLAAGALAAYHAIGLVHAGRNPTVGVILPPAAFVFFLISGFVIYRPLVADHLVGAPPADARRFWIERACRVFPLWWTALAVYTVVDHPTALHGVVDVALTVLLLQFARASCRFAVIGPAWALSVEWIFYLAAPLVALLTRRLHRLLPTAVTVPETHAAVLGALGVLTFAVGPIRPFVGIVAGMAAGAIDANRCRREPRRRAAPRPLAPGPVTVVLLTAAAWVVLARWPYGPGISVQWCQRDPVLTSVWLVAALSWFLPVAFARPSATVSRLLGSPAAHRLADLTFGIYLWHHLVLEQLVRRTGPHVPAPPIALLTIGGGAALAAATLVAVELPGRRPVRWLP